MSYEIVKEEDGKALRFFGFENGIAPSPHLGVGSMKGINISDSPAEAMVSFGRTRQTQSPSLTSGTLAQTSTNTVAFVGTAPTNGTWITISGSTISGLADGPYYVLTSTQLSATFSRSTSTAVTGMGAGTASWAQLAPLGAPIAGATEKYSNTSGNIRYRYYVVDTNGRLWVNDTEYQTIGAEAVTWVLPYATALSGTPCSGLAVAFGWVHIMMNERIYVVSTSRLGVAPSSFGPGFISYSNDKNPHFALASSQGRIYFTMGRYIASIFPNISVDPDRATNVPNVQSYCSYTSSSTFGTVSGVLNGSLPFTMNGARIPAYFFAAPGGAVASALSVGTKYYIECTQAGLFEVFAAATGGSSINITTGASGVQYFNTYWPLSGSITGDDTFQFTFQRYQLPANEIATCLGELGNLLIVGTTSNILYPFNQISNLPADLVPLPESGTVNMITVNNVLFVFAGNKGNVYITNGSSTSLALTVPDFVAGQVEPYFEFGGAAYVRGRVYFSVQDQTASKTGQCGGVWSFVPPQNFSYNEIPGLKLRVENINSYATYNGKVNVFIPDQDQTERGPRFWTAWTSSSTSPTYGIDYSADTPIAGQPGIIETDLAVTGTMLDKTTFQQIEYKLAAPLAASELVTIEYRTDISSAYSTLANTILEVGNDLSGFWQVDFQKTQWLQLRITLTPITSTSSSFVRLSEVRVR